MIPQEGLCNCWTAGRKNMISLLKLLILQLPEKYKVIYTEFWSSDDAENRDPGSMMDTQDNPERIF